MPDLEHLLEGVGLRVERPEHLVPELEHLAAGDGLLLDGLGPILQRAVALATYAFGREPELESKMNNIILHLQVNEAEQKGACGA